MPSGAEADHADTLGIDVPTCCCGADSTNGALRVEHRYGVTVAGTGIAAAAMTVNTDRSGDAEAIKECRDLLALMPQCQMSVATAGQDDDRGGRLIQVDLVDVQPRLIGNFLTTGVWRI